jgi:hypothetical protein
VIKFVKLDSEICRLHGSRKFFTSHELYYCCYVKPN